MKHLIAWTGLLISASLGLSQERIGPEDAEKYARLLSLHTATMPDLPLKTEANVEKPYGLKKDAIGILVIPDKNLSEDTFKKAGKEVTPIGQLWMRKVAPVVDGKVASTDQLRTVTLQINNEETVLPVMLLGVRKKNGDDLELVLYSKTKEPLVVTSVSKADSSQEMPIELQAEKGDDSVGFLTLNMLGKYKGTIKIGAAP